MLLELFSTKKNCCTFCVKISLLTTLKKIRVPLEHLCAHYLMNTVIEAVDQLHRGPYATKCTNDN